MPSVGNFYKGMLISVPLHLDTLPGKPIARDLETALVRHYDGSELVKVVPASDASSKGGRLEPEGLNGTNKLELRVFSHPRQPQAVLVARQTWQRRNQPQPPRADTAKLRSSSSRRSFYGRRWQ